MKISLTRNIVKTMATAFRKIIPRKVTVVPL